ncbi:MAG: CpsB/CapC family capsule biosynthesis tyrosine phosphatase [Thermotogota bacterium]|nr:CpsB/CapC family capsule biosynthesis tyrosine phosphatase [Thermotogota bacterium]
MKRNLVGVDMHCHLLPGVDDGSNSLEESVEIIKEMKENGIHKIFLTPHIHSPIIRSKPELFNERFKMLKKEIDEDMVLEMGSEVYIVPEVSKKDIIALGNSGYLLVEFPTNMFPVAAEKELSELQKRGYRIILAHIERYDYLFRRRRSGLFKVIFEPTDFLRKLKNMGVLFQVNWNTIVDPSPKEKKILNMLERYYWMDFTGSDKHAFKDNRKLINTANQKYRTFMNEELAI